MKDIMLKHVIDWTDLLEHAEECGFFWNYAHDILRVFQQYDGIRKIPCTRVEKLVPMNDPYMPERIKDDHGKYDLNQMGRDIVYSYMQKHNINEITTYSKNVSIWEVMHGNGI